MRLYIIIRKVISYVLVPKNSVINIEMSRTLITYTYENLLLSYRNMFKQSTRPDMIANKRTRRIINKKQWFGPVRVHKHGHRRLQWYYGWRVQGRGHRIGKSRCNRTKNSVIALANEKKIQYQPSFILPDYIYHKIRRIYVAIRHKVTYSGAAIAGKW